MQLPSRASRRAYGALSFTCSQLIARRSAAQEASPSGSGCFGSVAPVDPGRPVTKRVAFGASTAGAIQYGSAGEHRLP